MILKIQYDFDNNLLTYEFKNFREVTAKNGSHEVQITLKDKRGKESVYRISVKFKIQRSIVNNGSKSETIEENKASEDSDVYAEIK